MFKLFVPVAAAAIALVSCQPKEEQFGNNPAGEVTIRVHAQADNLKAGDQETKTYIDNSNTIIWGTGEYMKLALTAGETTIFVNSTDVSADAFDGDSEAMFEFNVTPESASEYVYQGLYPASAAATSSNTNAANYKVNLPAIQNATATSYDPAAYIMVTKPETFNTIQTEWVASYRRATALNKITLKNFASSVEINKVKITAEGKKLAGGRHFNLTTGEGLEVYGTDATIEVLYATPLSGTNVDVWFTSWDVEIAAGEKLTIVAYTTDSKSYTKEITVPEGKTIKFQEGYLNTLGANLNGINPVTVSSVEDGSYLVLARKGSEEPYTYYALTGEASGERVASVDYTGSLTSYNGDASLVWTISASGSSYTFKNASNYLGVSAVKSASLIDEESYEANACLMSIEDLGDGTYKITNTSTPEWILSRNTSNAYFAFYGTTGQYWHIVLVPATALEQVAAPTFDPAAGEVASGTEVAISCATSGATIHYTVDGTDPTSSSATYSSPIEITATTTIKAIAVKEGMADSEIASATYTIEGATSEWELVSDFSTIADGGEYIFVNVQNSTSYYMNTATCNQGAGTGCVALTTLPTDSGFDATDNMILVLSGSAEGFTASNKEGKQLKIGATNNGLAMNADSGTSLTFYTDENVSGYTLKGNDTNDVARYIGMNGTTNFRCYNSVNANVKTGEYVWYHHIGTGSNVTWNLESIVITTAPTKTVYTAGESFDPAGMVVTGHFVDADDATNTKDEAVTGYTISPDGALATTNTQVTITYQGKTATQNITVNAPSYVFETVAELNALVTATSAVYSGYLTNAVVSFVPATNTAIVKDATGSVMYYKKDHGLKQGQTFTGAISVTAIKYNGLYSEVTAWDASFSGSGAVVAPQNVALADLIGHYDDYQNAYVQVAGLTVSSIDGKNIHVTDGTNNYVVYDNTSSVSVAVGEVITAIGTITKYQTTEEIKVWKESDVTVTAAAPKAITFTQPSVGGSFIVSVAGSNITSGTTVASGSTVTLTATAVSGYTFSGWTVTGATVADASSATTTFTMGTSPVVVIASFSNGSASSKVTYDFTGSDWSVSNGSLTNGTVSFTGAGDSFKMNTGYFILGKSGAYINFPAYDYPVQQIVVTGRSGASSSVKQNIFVGNTAVSAETTGATGTNTYSIASDYQAVGTIYTLKVTSAHNTQITKIEVFF